MHRSGTEGRRPASKTRTRRGVLAAGVAAGVLAGISAFDADDPVRRGRRQADEHRVRRLPAIRTALAAAKPGFVFLAGNSHAELLGDALARRLPVVNGGIGGASARSYAKQVETFSFGAKAGIAVLFVGTNDILRTGEPLSEGTLAGFVAAVTRILDGLRARADIALVAAVPPIGPEASATRDPAAVAVYTNALRGLCERERCHFFDPFRRLRDGDEGLTGQAVPPDGVHLRDYDGLAADLATLLRAMGHPGPGLRSE